MLTERRMLRWDQREAEGSLRIWLVRHAEPQASPLVDEKEWPLSAAGRSAAESLRGLLPTTGPWLSSTEVKAYETLVCAKRDIDPPITQDVRLNEVHRVEPFDDEFRARRRAWVDGRPDERHAGWETPLEAAMRFDAAIRDHSTSGSTLVIGSHGMVLTAWLVHARGAVDQRAAGSLWEEMTLPDVIEVRQD